MAERIQQTTEKQKTEAQETTDTAPVNPEIRAHAEETISDIDALLDEIDGVLEQNAEEFVNAYQQKGGQ